MGFRNPVTTAAAVDTGHGPADAGVRLYQDTSFPSVPQGVAEWRTGSMDRNASIRLAGGFSGGSAYTIDGGRALGVNAPQLSLEVDSLPAGGYGPTMWLTAGAGGRIFTDTPIQPQQTRVRVSSLVAFASGWVDYDTYSPGSPYGKAELWVDAAGVCHLDGIFAYVSATAIAAGASGNVFTGLPAKYRPTRNQLFGGVGGTNTFLRMNINLDGSMSYTATGGGITQGQFISACCSWLPAALGT